MDVTASHHAGGSYVLRFQNRSSRSCTLTGYPTVVADGRVTAEHAGSGAHTVRLAPSGYASAALDWNAERADSSGQCTDVAHRFSVTAPGGKTVPYNRAVGLCGFVVHPLVSGTAGGR